MYTAQPSQQPRPIRKMLLRPATEHDIPEMAAVGAAAYVNDPIDVYLYANRHVHPADYRKAYAQNIKRMLTRPGETHATVAVLEPSDEGYDGRPTLVGYTAWRRFRASETQRQPEKKTFAQRKSRRTHDAPLLTSPPHRSQTSHDQPPGLPLQHPQQPRHLPPRHAPQQPHHALVPLLPPKLQHLRRSRIRQAHRALQGQ